MIPSIIITTPRGRTVGSVLDCLVALETAARTFEDDKQGASVRDFALSQLQAKCAKAKNQKLANYKPRVLQKLPSAYPDDLRERVNAAHRGFAVFCRAGYGV